MRKRHCVRIGAVVALAGWTSWMAAVAAAVEADPISPGSWTMVILPDTQHYSEEYPAIYNAQTAWIAAHKDSHNIKMVLHEGDITDGKTATEFARAKTAMDALRTAGVPYSMAPGNHDYTLSTRTTLFNDPTYFGSGSTYATQSHFQGTSGGFFQSGKTDNSWCTFNAGGEDWLIFSVEYGPRDSVVSWMNTVAADHPNHNLILNTHAYLYYDSTRYDYATYGDTQSWSPHAYGNDGQQLWDKLVKNYENWKFTFNGHVLEDGTGWLGSEGVNGNVVHQMLINYQVRDQGGEGYLRIMEFKDDGQSVKVSSYSPYVGSYYRVYDHDFTLNMNELPPPAPPVIRGVSAAAVNVAAGTTNATSVWTIVGSGPGNVIAVSTANIADLSLGVDAVPLYRYEGMLMATVRQNVRGSDYGTVEVSHTNFFSYLDNDVLQVATSKAPGGKETNMNVAVAFFPFADGWIAGHVLGDGSLLEHYGVSASNVGRASQGRYTVSVDDMHSVNDGMLFAVGAANGFNYCTTAPLADGSGWQLAVRDNTAAFGAFEDNRWSFLYVDYDAPGLTGGRVNADGTLARGMGALSVSRVSTGVYRITVDGGQYTPAEGVLLLTIAEYETGSTAPDDNIISYEADGNTFLVNIRDPNDTGSPLEDGAFVFAFLPYDGQLTPAIAGDANYDGIVNEADAAILAEHWGDAGATWAMGDFNLNGRIDAADASILAANWGHGSEASRAVPEPSALGLAIGALLVFLSSGLPRRQH